FFRKKNQMFLYQIAKEEKKIEHRYMTAINITLYLEQLIGVTEYGGKNRHKRAIIFTANFLNIRNQSINKPDSIPICNTLVFQTN
ncbi:MAG: hypothetical protein K6F69_05945, partial [Treponema sp.]|nr:hypothetical protein [Treponema sp.]